MWRVVKNLKIRQKILLSFLLVICFCLSTTIYITSTRVSSIIRNKTIIFSQQIVNKTMENVDYYLLDTKYLAKNIALDDQINKRVIEITSRSASIDHNLLGQVDSLVNKYKYIKNYIIDISLINDSESFVYNFIYDYKDSIAEQDWYLKYRSANLDSYFTQIHPSIIRDSSLSRIDTVTFFQKVYNPDNPSIYLYTIAIEMDARVFNSAVSQLNSNNGWVNLVLNADNEIINKPSENAAVYESELIKKIVVGKEDKNEVVINKIDYLILKSSSPDFKWNVISFVPQKEIMSEAYSVQLFLLTIGFILLLLAFIMSSIISKGITNPLQLLMKSIKEIEKGNLEVRSVIKTGDEIEEVSDVFNSMVTNINSLILKNKEEEKLKRKAELTALQAQINPHFLYNILESLNWYAVRKKEMEISDVITNLGKFFRISLSKGSQFISIAQEIEHAKSYINIQKFRISNGFNEILDVEDNISNLYTPKLILQPIIENCILHGVRNIDRIGNIHIRAFEDNEAVLFIIKDDGVGIETEKLIEIRRVINGFNAIGVQSYGLKNVNERIQLCFGKTFGIDINSNVGSGTEVLIRIPVLKELPSD